MAAGRYSAGRIFLQVVPSFKGVQRETAREVEKLNKNMASKLDKGVEIQAKKSGEKAGRAYMGGFEKGTVAEDAKYRIALRKFITSSQAEQRKANKKIMADAMEARRREVAAQFKEAERAEKKMTALHARAIAANMAVDAKAAAARTRAAEKEAADAEARENKMVATHARAIAMNMAHDAKAAADRQRQADQEAAAAEARENKANARHARGIAANMAFDRRAAADRKALADKEEAEENKRLQRRGGAVRKVINDTLKSVDRTIGETDLGTRVGGDLDVIRQKARALNTELSNGTKTTREAAREIKRLGRDMRSIGRQGIGAGADKDTKRNIREASNEISLMGRRINEVGGNTNILSRGLNSLNKEGQDGANAFRIFNYRILAVAATLPLVIPLLAAAAGGMLALSVAALGVGAALGVMLLGFSGVSDAVKALGDVQDNAAKDNLAYSKTMRNASRSVRDAQQGVSRARMQAARAAEDSNRRIADAEDKLAQSQKDATKAQEDLRAARKAAQQDQQDLADKITAGKLDERQALIDLFNAQVDYNAAIADGGATNLEKEQASINLARAQLGIKNIREENAALAAESKKTAKDGIEGDANVVAAKEKVADSAVAIKDAEQGVRDAQRDARDQAVDSALAMRDANERLADSQAAYREALVKTGVLGSASMQALQSAMGKLGPAGQEFARYIHSLRDDFYAIREIAQEGMFPGLMTMLKTLQATYGPGFKDFVGVMSKGLGDFFVALGDLLTSPAFQGFFKQMADLAPIFAKQFGDVFLNLLTALVGIMQAFAPFAVDFGNAIVGISKAFADWALGLKDNPQFQAFLVYLRKEGPKIWKLLLAIVGAFVNLAVALAPFAGKLLDFAIAFFGWIASMDPAQLRNIALAILGFVLAAQIVAGTIQLFITFSQLIGAIATVFELSAGAIITALLPIIGIVLLVVAVIALIAIGVYLLWTKCEWFRTAVKTTWDAIAGVFTWLWDTIMKPIFDAITLAWQDLWAIIKWAWGLIGPVIELFGAVWRKLWDDYLAPVFGWIGDKFSWLGGLITDTWTKYIDPILDKFGLGAGDLQGYWETALTGIGKAWEWLKSAVYKPIEWIVNTVINKGFVDNFNKLAEVFGTTKIPHLVLPSMDTTTTTPIPTKVGGQRVNRGQFDVGGYTGPGSKYQPAGVVHASEYVIRKESTDRIRSKYGLDLLDYINRHGDFPGFASGGLVAFGKRLQSMGYNVSEHPSFGGVHPVHAKNSWHYRAGAVDVNYDGHGQSFEDMKINAILGLAKEYGLRIIWQAPGHFNHAHFDISTGADMGDVAGSKERSKDLPWYLDKPMDFLRGVIEKMTDKFQDTWIGKFVAKIPLKILDFAAEKIASIINAGDHDDKQDRNNPMFGVKQWESTVLAALARLHQPSSKLGVTLRRMNQESSGDPKAINNWDINAKNGTPSKGLMQVIDPTFAAYRDKGLPNDIWNPMANIVASMKYALSRYGSLDAAYGRSGGYAEGGLVTSAGESVADNGVMLYDRGGYLPPGMTTVLNMTGRPEPVFSPAQYADGGLVAGGGRAPLIGSVTVPMYGTDVRASDVASEIMYAVTRVDHGGKYAGRTA